MKGRGLYMRTAIVNGVILSPNRRLEGYALVMEGNQIVELTQTPVADTIVDAQGCYVSPGFIDLHTHGGGGHDFMDGTVEAIIGACKTHLKHGTTSMVPTTLTSTNEELYHFFDCYRKAKETMVDGPELLGIHMEGPYFSMEQRGAQDPQYLKTPNRAEYLDYLARSADIVRISAAPELEGGLEMGRELSQRGVLAAIGHSDATYDTVVQAYDAGYQLVTHLYSGMSTIRRINAYRHLGVVESAYLLDGLYVEVIADGNHLPPELLKLIVKCKAKDKICLVTDSMRGAGLPEGSTVLLGSLTHGQPCIIENGVAMVMDRTSFAGSVCTSDRCIRTMYHKAGVPLEDAVGMMTENPARVMKIDHKKGRLAPGMDADICIFNENIEIQKVFVGGHMVEL